MKSKENMKSKDNMKNKSILNKYPPKSYGYLF